MSGDVDHYWHDRIGQYQNPWSDPGYATVWDDLVADIQGGMDEDDAWKKYDREIVMSYSRRGIFDDEEGNQERGPAG